MVERLAARFGIPEMRVLALGWLVSAVLLVAGAVVLLSGGSGLVGFALFIVGAALSVMVTFGVLRLRAPAAARTRKEQ